MKTLLFILGSLPVARATARRACYNASTGHDACSCSNDTASHDTGAGCGCQLERCGFARAIHRTLPRRLG